MQRKKYIKDVEGDEPQKTKYGGGGGGGFEAKRNMSCGRPPKKDLDVWDPPSPKRKPQGKSNIPKQSVTNTVKPPSKPVGPPRPNIKSGDKNSNGNNLGMKDRQNSNQIKKELPKNK
jgi:hypothetical protein